MPIRMPDAIHMCKLLNKLTDTATYQRISKQHKETQLRDDAAIIYDLCVKDAECIMLSEIRSLRIEHAEVMEICVSGLSTNS